MEKQPVDDRIPDSGVVSEGGPVTAQLHDLIADAQNRRAHNPRNVAMIADSLRSVGAARSIVIDEAGVILAGNATVQAAAEAGIQQVRIIETDGEELIAVRRRGLTTGQKRALALADNRAAELAAWNVEQLRSDVAVGIDLAAFFAPVELADLLGTDAPVPRFEPVEAEHRLDELQPHCETCTCRQGAKT